MFSVNFVTFAYANLYSVMTVLIMSLASMLFECLLTSCQTKNI